MVWLTDYSEDRRMMVLIGAIVNYENMVFLNQLPTKGKLVLFFLNTENDATYVIDKDTESVLFMVEFDGKAYRGNCEEYIGHWMTDAHGLWFFIFEDGRVDFNSGNKDLIKAEAKLFKMLMGGDDDQNV